MNDTERHEQWLIDIESRVRFLETLSTPSDYSLSHPEEEQAPVYQDMEWTPRQWDTVRHLIGTVLHLQSKVNEKQSIKKGLYNKYS